VTRLSFRINRDDGASLTEQVVSGLRHAIRSGSFRTGDSLPTRKEMAKQTGVSEETIRHAVKRLADEGLLRVRTRTGATVNSLRGHVLYLTWNPPDMYYDSMLTGVVTKRLHAAHVFLSVTHVTWEEAIKDFPKVQADLVQSLSLAVVMGGMAAGVDALLVHKGLPFVHFTPSNPSPHAARAILIRHAPVFPTIRDHCLACGAREILMVELFPNDERNTQIGKLLADAGVHCQTMTVQPILGLESAEVVEHRALDTMNAWLEREKRLPDLIWFSDDYVAQGALLAMTARGVRIPEDVQVISWANSGLGPVFLKPLTRVEMDPIRHGEVVAACVLDQLKGNRSGRKPIVLSPVFIEGETTVKKTRRRRSL
jgi:DNA-binding LacI/PurR family transcriptional regulator